jgi:hypothetical protein
LALLALLAQPPRASAQVWTSSDDFASPLVVISANDAAALLAMQRALPHYGGKSWLVFEGGQVMDPGIWPAHGRAVSIEAAKDF